MTVREGLLVLSDGSAFEGELIGAAPPTRADGTGGTGGTGGSAGVAAGEVVFNTALSGYQEIVTDPSYAGQIITFTYPHIGNYGTNPTDFEAARPWCRGVVVRELARRHSNWRAESSLDGLLRAHGIPGIAGVDTRRLTRVLREQGAMPGAFGPAGEGEAALRKIAAEEPGTHGVDLVAEVTTPEPYALDGPAPDAPLVVAYDFGIKRTILRHLARRFRVEVVPAATPAADVLDRDPAGVFLSNGPGDPATVPYAVDAIGRLLGNVPIFGICLGHQLLGRALGAETVKLPFGHHGANHPVRDLRTGKVEITSQNHNFAVPADALAGVATVTHLNLNDGVCEGMAVNDERAFSVQYHPEAGPGPHDSSYLFDQFADLVAGTTALAGSGSGGGR